MKVALAELLGITVCLLHDVRAVAVQASIPPPNPDEVTLPAVPSVNAGKSGFPELPTVDDLLQASVQTLSGLSSGAQKLQAQLLSMEKDQASHIQRQKSVFDHKLKDQEEKNMAVVQENAKIARDIMEMKKANQELLEHALSLQKGNSQRHSELTSIQEQLSAVQTFAQSAFSETDDSKASDLEILTDGSTTNQQVQAKSSTNSSLPPTSFLELSQVTDPIAETAQPQVLVTMLQDGVKAMKQQGEASQGKLKELFLRSFEAGIKRHRALLAQQEVLQATLKKMKAYHEKLKVADNHLQHTQSQLDTRLQEGSAFLAKLSKVVAETPEDAAKSFEYLKASQHEKAQ